jgi:acetate---CoA ligase (ADP-forming)
MTIGHIPERDAMKGEGEAGGGPPPPAGQRRAEPGQVKGEGEAGGPARHGASPSPPRAAVPTGQGPVRPRHDGSPPYTPVEPGQHSPSALAPMLEARSIALVGASPRPGTFGQRMLEEVTRSPSRPEVHLVNPKYAEIGGQRCVPSLDDLPGPVDLVLLAVPDAALEQQLARAARRGDRSAVIFGNAHEDPTGHTDPSDPRDLGEGPPFPGEQPATGPPEPAGPVGLKRPVGSAGPLRQRLAASARSAGMQLCGAGCMGFVNVAHGLRAIGYAEPDPLPAGPVALVTHSGSVFSTMLRTRRAIGYTLAVSSGQELVTAAASYIDYALGLAETKVLALVLEAIREPDELRRVLARAAERDVPVLLLTAGRSASGRMMVAAHSGALAADDGGWEALARAYGIHRVGDLAELADALELFAIGRRSASRDGGRDPAWPAGIASVHDSGLERAHAVDLADEIGVPFAAIGEVTKARLADLLDPGLVPTNPLDVWGTGADTRSLFTQSLITLAEDPSVDAVALAVDLVRELDGDESYRLAVLDAAAQTTKPVVVLGNLAGAVDPDVAGQLRQYGIPVLEGLRTGLLALRHLLDHASRSRPTAPPTPATPGELSRRDRGAALLAAGVTGGAPLLALLAEYGITTAAALEASDEAGALAAAESIGYPVVLKTADPAITHKSDVRGVFLGIPGPAELARAYADLSARLGPLALVCESVPAGTELAVGIARDPDLGPLIVVGAGGVLVELLADRAVALPPVDEQTARQMLSELRLSRLLAGIRGAPPADLDAVSRAILSISRLAADLGDKLLALDVNPLICGPHGAVAVDALAVPVGALTTHSAGG